MAHARFKSLSSGTTNRSSPSAVGQEVAIVQNLIDQFLQGIPNADLYDGQTSVYDLARQYFGGTVRLVEHFRCVPDVIQFSIDLSYFGNIKPLRDSSRVVLRPHTISLRVSGSTKDGKVNRQEAEVVASLITAVIEQPEYQFNEFRDRTSFGGPKASSCHLQRDTQSLAVAKRTPRVSSSPRQRPCVVTVASQVTVTPVAAVVSFTSAIGSPVPYSLSWVEEFESNVPL